LYIVYKRGQRVVNKRGLDHINELDDDFTMKEMKEIT
jgi:hypothetical protein